MAPGCVGSAEPNGEERVLERLTAPERLDRSSLAAAVLRAEARLAAFAAAHGWDELGRASYYDRVEVCATQAALWARVLELHDLPPQPLPTSGLVAGLEQRVLLAVPPTEYARLQPAYAAAGDDAWSQLLTHELVHRLHVAILEGDEDAMGPQWFFEGFAVHGAGQEILAEVPPGPVADQIAWAEGAQEHAYSRFGGLVASLAARIPLPELVAHAGQADFLDWLQERLER